MKKFLFGILFLILLVGGFFIYQFGSDFGLNFGGKKLEAKTYGEIKEDFEKDSKNISIEDAYLLAKNEDDEKYYRALYEVYKKEDKDLGLQYLYNEFVMNNNKKVYPILKEEAKSDVTFTATETGYNETVKNHVGEMEGRQFTFVPKYYNSKTKDDFAYSLISENFDDANPGLGLPCTTDWPTIRIKYINSNGSTDLTDGTCGFQAGEDKLFFKNFDGKTIVALSMTDYGYPIPWEDTAPVLYQVFFYKDYLMAATISGEDYADPKYRSYGIGTYDPFTDGYLEFYKGSNEISQEEFEKNVVPVNKLVKLSKAESKTWIKISTGGILGPHRDKKDEEYTRDEMSARQAALSNMVLYGYDISLDKDVDLPYLRPYLKHLYTNKYSSILLDPNKKFGDGRDCFFASVCDLDKDGYPEIIMNYLFEIVEDELYEYHTKVIGYDPEKKSTYILGEFMSFDSVGAVFEESGMGGLYTENNKNYLAVVLNGNTRYRNGSYVGLYQKVGKTLECINSSIEISDAGLVNEYVKKYGEPKIYYPTINSKDYESFRNNIYPRDDKANNLFTSINLPKENSKEKFYNLYDKVLNEEVREEINTTYRPAYNFKYGNIFKSMAFSDIDEIKDILLANKMLSLPSYKRLAIGEKYYPKEVILIEDGKTYVDISVLKDIKGLKVNKDEANILEKDKNKYIDLQDLIKLDLVTSENQDLVRLKEKL